MDRILAVDYGRRRIGLAVSDPLGITAQGLPTLEVRGKQEALTAVAAVAQEKEAGEIVVGLPLNMDGSRGAMAEAAEAFAGALGQLTGLPVCCWDERWTSQGAHRAMREMGRTTRKNKGEIDRISAMMLLDSYLQSQHTSMGRNE